MQRRPAEEVEIPGERSLEVGHLLGDMLDPRLPEDVVPPPVVVADDFQVFLLAVKLRPVLWQVSAFTVAHTITLALTVYGVVSLPSRVIEPLIALSIVDVAVENVFTSKLHAWRPVVVFCFGLLHGMGFAGVLTQIGLPRSEFVPALLSFNLGVECGQLAVIFAAFVVLGLPFRNKPWYRRRIVIPGSLLIAAVGLYWSIERGGQALLPVLRQ